MHGVRENCARSSLLEHASSIYDVPFRHQQALDSCELSTTTTTLHAIEKAVEDWQRRR